MMKKSTYVFLLVTCVVGISGNPSENADDERHYTHPFKERFFWNTMDFAYTSSAERQAAIANGSFVPTKVFPVGVAAFGSRIFVSTPRLTQGIPATLSYLTTSQRIEAPKLQPYPNWSKNRQGNCDGLTSVYRVKIDQCDRMWVLDTGSILIPTINQLCPPQVVVFDLHTNDMIRRFQIPSTVVRPISNFISIEVEYPDEKCDDLRDAYVYIADPRARNLVVIRMSNLDAWAVNNPTTQVDPAADAIVVDGNTISFNDGVSGVVLGPLYQEEYRKLYYTAISSYKQNFVETRVLRNKTRALSDTAAYKTVPVPRPSQSAGIDMDNNGVLYFGLLSKNGIGCWHTHRRITTDQPDNWVSLVLNSTTIKFITNVMVDRDEQVWAVASGLIHLMDLNPDQVNFRIFVSQSESHNVVEDTRCEHFH